MEINAIVSEMKRKRDELNRAIEALEGVSHDGHVPPPEIDALKNKRYGAPATKDASRSQKM